MKSGRYPQYEQEYRRESGRASDRGRSGADRFSHGYAGSSRGHRPVPHLKDSQGTLDWIGDVIKIVLIIVVIMFCVSMSHRAYEIGYNIFYEKAVAEKGSGQTVEVTITDGMTVTQIGKLLQEKGLIKDEEIFSYQERFSSYHGKIVPGTYELSTEMTPSEMIKKMAENYKEANDSDEPSSTSQEQETGDAAAEDDSASVSSADTGELSDSSEQSREGQQAE